MLIYTYDEAWRLYSKKLRGYEFSDDEMRNHMFGRTNANIGIIIAIASIESDDVYKSIPFVTQIIHNFNEINTNIFN